MIFYKIDNYHFHIINLHRLHLLMCMRYYIIWNYTSVI